MSTTLEPSRLSASEQGALRCLSTALHHPKQPTQATITVDDQRIPMPSVALGLVAELVGHLAAGRSVTVLSNEEEISPREAAQLLGVSRPFAARLFDEGKIPSRRVGTHRRASVADVLIYRARCEGWAEPGKEEGMRLRRRGLQPLLLARIFPGYE